MTPFERFCKDHNVFTNSEFFLEHEGSNYRVILGEDDESSQVKFKILETLSSDPEYSVDDTVWGYISGLTPVTVELDGVKIEAWDYTTAARLKIKADAAVKEYNDYISKQPDVVFNKF